jgi:hypothetical protein
VVLVVIYLIFLRFSAISDFFHAHTHKDRSRLLLVTVDTVVTADPSTSSYIHIDKMILCS